MSTQLFNRLHNILQNSTVYLTYPTNRTSRFSHSLGCMDIAGAIFLNGIINAQEEDRKRYFSQANEELDGLEKVVRPKTGVGRNAPINGKTEFFNNYKVPLHDPYYSKKIPAFLETAEDQRNFIILFQAIRLAALLHDVGHPPFSHISEFAIMDLYKEYSTNRSDNQNEQVKKFISIIDTLIKSTEDELGEKQTTQAIHEKIGLDIVDFLLGQLQQYFWDERDTKEKKSRCINIEFINEVVIRIFKTNEGNSFYTHLHEIISGDLDADRLDYIRRDLKNSSINTEAYKYGRLFSSFQLVYSGNKQDCGDENKQPHFFPSVRALSTIEKVFQARRELYKYVIYHHRVSKTDCILRNIIIELSKKWLEKDEPMDDTKALDVSNISAIWKSLDQVNSDFEEDRLDSLLQWDDPWLLSILRNEFRELQSEGGLTETEERLRDKLEEILSNKKNYYSLFKRVDTFRLIDESFIKASVSDEDGSKIISEDKLITFAEKLLQDGKKIPPIAIDQNSILKKYHEYVSRYLKDEKSNFRSSTNNLWSENGFFINNLINFFRFSAKFDSTDLSFIEDAFKEVSTKYDNMVDYLYMPRFYKSAIGPDLKLIASDDSNYKTSHISAFSPISGEEKRFFKFIPPFYIYLRPRKSAQLDFTEISEEFGKVLWAKFVDWFNSTLIDLMETENVI